MFIAMLIFVNPYISSTLPDESEIVWATPGGRLWTYYGFWMHLVMAFLHFLMMASCPTGTQVYRLVFQIIAVVGQVLNFCIISTLYTESPPMEILTSKQ